MIDMERIEQLAYEMRGELVEIRRTLHKCPEIEFDLYKTSEYVCAKLTEYGIPYRTVCGTGIDAVIEGGAGDKCVLLRADMDALPITEEADVDFKSENAGAMHACGHDIHTACLLGATKILASGKCKFDGTVKLIFQPAEEGDGGAEPMISAGVMKNPDVTAAFAMHVEPMVPVGTVLYKNGAITACPDNFFLTVKGVGGHGAHPNECVDPITVGAMIVTAYRNITSSLIDPMTPCVVSVGSFHAGNCTNAIPDTAVITGTVRAFDNDTRERLIYLLEKIARDIAASMGAEIEYRYDKLYPPAVNDRLANELVTGAAAKLDAVTEIRELEKPSMIGDDFSYFGELVPASYFKLGVGNKDKGCIYPIHSPKFKADEDALPIGAALMAQIAVDYLNKQED